MLKWKTPESDYFFSREAFPCLEQEGWTAAEMPAGPYIAQGETIPTVAMTTSLGFHADVSEDVVYAITSVICDFAERVRQIHPAAHNFMPSRACLNKHGILHLGAARYFQSKGFLTI